jgi:hypothetical protein
MASWSLLLALSGYHYDSAERQLRFAPAGNPGDFKCFFSAPAAWGSLAQTSGASAQTARVIIKRGTLALQSVRLALPENARFTSAALTVGGKTAPARLRVAGRMAEAQFEPLLLQQGDELTLNLS